MALDTIALPPALFRIGRRPDPWAWPPWEVAGADGTFGNRWDDAEGVYRVVYACSRLEGCFAEVLARFRPDPAVVAALAEIEGDPDSIEPGVVPTSWLAERRIGEASVSGVFADVGMATSLAHLQRALASRLIHHGVSALDGAAIRATAPRRLTQEISNYVYRLAHPDGMPIFAGIEYQSRLGDDFQNWAIFERPGSNAIRPGAVQRVEPDLPALRVALTLLGLRLGRG